VKEPGAQPLSSEFRFKSSCPMLREKSIGQGLFPLLVRIKNTSNSSLPFAIALLIALCAGCATRPLPAPNTRQFTDELGRTINVATSPERIISLAPSITETLFALGIGDKIVGVTSYCDYPPEAKTKESIGDTLKPSLEKIIALKPDLVIVSTSSQLESFVRSLEDAGIPVYVSNPRNLEETLKTMQAVGDVAGAKEQAIDLTDKLRARIERTRARVATKEPPAVFVMLGAEPLITVGGASFLNDLITRAGGRSISADEKSDYPQYSFETVIARKPEVIFLQAGDDKLPERLRQTPAAKSGRLYHLNDDLLLRPGPRIVDGLELIAEKLHPY
jgi:iron complex transport system substrate-binding protein